MKNFETITCPVLKEKKLKEKEARREAKIRRNFTTPVQKVEPVKTSSNFTDMRALMDLEEQHEAATMIQKHVRRCMAECKLSQLKEMKIVKKANKGKKKRKKTEKVYCEMPDDM
jgi:hypothetical protein